MIGHSKRLRRALVVVCGLVVTATAAIIIGVSLPDNGAGDGNDQSDPNLGIDSLAAESSAILLAPYALYPTQEERHRVEDKEYQWVRDEATGYERERWWFERTMRSVAIHAHDSLPVEVGTGGILEEALHRGYDKCAVDSGWPGVQLYDVSSEYVAQLEAERDLALSAFLDLRHVCSIYAMTFPSLNAAERDRLLTIREQHFANAMREYVEENPDSVVPPKANEEPHTPFNDMLVEICLSLQSRADQEHCAEEYRIRLH